MQLSEFARSLTVETAFTVLGSAKALKAKDPVLQYGQTAAMQTYDGAGLFARSEPLYREALQAAQKEHGKDHQQTASALGKLGLNLLQQKKPAEAEPMLRECLALREKKMPKGWPTYESMSMLGAALSAQPCR